MRMTTSIKTILTLAMACALFGAGCLDVTIQPKPTIKPGINSPFPTATSTATDAPVILPDNLAFRTVTYPDGRTVSFALAKMPYDKYRFALANDPAAPKTVAAWRDKLGASMVINGSYFSEDMKPSGYYRLDGKAYGNWPNTERQHEKTAYTGMVRIRDGRLALIHLVDDPQPTPDGTDQTLLTFPTLVANGVALVESDTQKYARRTALATAADGMTYVIVTQSGAVSLRELADWLANQPEKFRIAVNLDGGPSTGMSFASGTSAFEEPSAPIPNVVAAYPK